MTTWYLQSHRTWDRLCQSCIGSSFLPRGAFRKGSLCRLARECTPDRSEALWVTRPEAVASAGSKDRETEVLWVTSEGGLPPRRPLTGKPTKDLGQVAHPGISSSPS